MADKTVANFDLSEFMLDDDIIDSNITEVNIPEDVLNGINNEINAENTQNMSHVDPSENTDMSAADTDFNDDQMIKTWMK